MGWTSDFLEITETTSADAFEMTCTRPSILANWTGPVFI